jgi:N-acetylglucosamine-6-phosphate deacetylase
VDGLDRQDRRVQGDAGQVPAVLALLYRIHPSKSQLIPKSALKVDKETCNYKGDWMKTAFLAAECVGVEGRVRNAVVVVEDGIVVSVGAREQTAIPSGASMVDLGDDVLAPGFIDMHIHGGAGHDVMEGTQEAIAALELHLARHGTTSYCPTTVSARMDVTLRALEFLANEIEAVPRRPAEELRARPLGIHLEGPFISKEKAGAHPLECIAEPSLGSFDRLWEAARGHVKVMTIAPEVPGAEEVIREAASRGVCVSLGHSNATLEQTRCGIAAGGRHVTHVFNAMRPLDHREPGILGCALADDSISAEMIVDGVHVHPEIVKLFLDAKRGQAVLVTDAISATGMPDGQYQLGGFVVEVKGDVCTSHGRLAGSVLTLDRALRNVMKFTGATLDTALRMATMSPARTLGLCGRKGVIGPGADADFVLLTTDGQVSRTIVGGRSQ